MRAEVCVREEVCKCYGRRCGVCWRVSLCALLSTRKHGHRNTMLF